MTNVQAAIGVAQLEMLPEFIKRKQNNYHSYREKLKQLDKVQLLPFREGTDSNHWFYSIIMKGIRGDQLREKIETLQKKGIQTRPVWGLIHEQKPYRSYVNYRIEQAEEYADKILNIPCSTSLTEDEINLVVREIAE